jgi:glyoxylase-like metal-dependent hydrolase (beta-lactamase superfamily II)
MRFTREDTIVQLTYLPNLFPVNCYLVEEEAELTLVDTALPNNADAIIQAAARIGKPITRIVLTHAHSDHIGALDRLKQQLPEARLFISGRDARLLAGDVSLDPQEADMPIRGGVPKPGSVAARPDELLHGGERIGSLLAVPAPGHTPGSMAFMDTRNRILIVGDAFQTRSKLAVSGHLQPLFPFPALATWDKQTSLHSAKTLLALKPTLLAAGHGNMIQQPALAMEQAIAAAGRAFAKQKPNSKGA